MKFPLRQRQLRQDARSLFGRPEGKRLLRWMAKRFHLLGSCFDESPTRHAFLEGERNAGLEILELCAITPEELEGLYRDARLETEGEED